jgi:hypothetical protein
MAEEAALRQLVSRWRDDPGTTCRSWFLLLPLVAVVAIGGSSCGGKASSETHSVAAAGASGASPLGGAAGADARAAEESVASVVQLSGNDGDIDPQATPECLTGFQGFYAHVGGMTVDFKAFVFEPGDFEGDPMKILWLDALRPNGEHYRATAGTVGAGKISLHVVQVEPRFIGSLEASLPAVDDPALEPLMLRLSFDIAARAGCH